MTPVISFQRILAPTDFGDAAMHAADVACAFAERDGGSVTLVHAWLAPPTYSEGFTWAGEGLEEAAQKALDEEIARLHTRFPRVAGVLTMGDPWDIVLHVADEQNADLIVMGTHGRRGLPRLWLGSVAERVVRMSKTPVLTVHCPEETK